MSMPKEKAKPKYWIILADPQVGAVHWQHPVRENDYYAAFQNQCRIAADDPLCLGILGLGDLRERASIQARNLGGMNRGLRMLAEAGKSMLALMGNHDRTEPSWITEMCYPSLKDLTDPEVQAEHGFDPATTLALHFTPKGELREKLEAEGRKGYKLVFLHQSLRELTTHLLASHDLSLAEMAGWGFGQETPCQVFLGDIHNYGDCVAETGNLGAVYPGSPEMTDINEGVNGLKSRRLPSEPHDYRKFVLHFFPEKMKSNPDKISEWWKPVEIPVRPWFRGKAKTKKEADRILTILAEHSKTWESSPCILLTLPKEEVEGARKMASALKPEPLVLRVEEYDPDVDAEEDPEGNVLPEQTMSWQQNKASLLELGEKEQLPEASLALLREICSRDGSTHNPKGDINAAWEVWTKGPEKEKTAEE
jgi:hypothetical protein